MYTIIAGGTPAPSSTRSRGRFPRRRSYDGPREKSFNPKKGFRKHIDKNLFVNAASHTEVESYTPKHVFADFGVHPLLLENLTTKGLVKPSPIQDSAIPIALSGKDIIGIASTGTGKTAAFLIPLINKLVSDREHKILILTPTRELAIQVEEQFLAFTKGMKLFSVSCVGGSPIMRQIKELELGVHVVIGTPGRVKDLIARGKINMTLFTSVVLDEADRMLDMGFIDDMREILGLMPKDKQGLFFSATFSKDIKRLCEDFLNAPETIEIRSRDTASSVEQDVVTVAHPDDRIEALVDILAREDAAKVLVFRETKRSVDELATMLRARNILATPLHGDMHNRDRERAVSSFSMGRVQVLIATDVAARGIDINDISYVINYDIPSTYETYIHRIGRTGRGMKRGKALTFLIETRRRY